MQYCDSEYADAYFADRAFSEAWTGGNKDKFLATASMLIARYCKFYDDLFEEVTYSESTAPDELKNATCEQALYLMNLGFDPTQPKKVNTLGISSTEGTVFDKAMTASVLCREAIAIIRNMGGSLVSGASNGISSGFAEKI